MTAAEVLLWGTKIGTIVFDDNRDLGFFEYDPAFLESGIQLSPIVMPLGNRVYSFPELSRQSFHGLPGLLADSLPDKFGNAVIDAWLTSQGRRPESFDPVERLCYTGSRGMGALEYVPALGPDSQVGDLIQVEELRSFASDILQNREKVRISKSDSAMQNMIRVGTSAGGARAKAIVAWDEQNGLFRSGQINAGKGYSYWLVKFDGVSGNGDKEGEDAPQYTRIEYAYYLMAIAAGIRMSECRLYEEQGYYHFMTRRFDRNINTGDKIHMQSLAAIAHYDFNMAGAHSYEQAGRVMNMLRLPHADIAEFFRRMVFNVVGKNHDDHVKNISFLMDRSGRWSLSPAYDVTYAYNPDGIWTRTHQMTINGKRDYINREDLLSTARFIGIRKAEANRIIKEVSAALSRWPAYAEKSMLSERTAEAIQREFVIL